jgi:hypothetical protein
VANTSIQLKYSTVTGNTPSSLALGELAINSFDGKLFYSDPSGNVKFFNTGSGPSEPSGLNKEVQFNDAGLLSGNSQFTFDKAQTKLTVGNGSIGSDTLVTSNTLQTPILSFPTLNYGSGKFLIQANNESSRQITELLVVHDGTNAYATEYAIIRTNEKLFNIDVDILSGNVRILTTSSSSNLTTYKVASTLLSV